MKKLLLAVLLIASINAFAQKPPIKKSPVVKDSTTSVKDTTVLIVLTPKEYETLINWIDNINAPHQEVKAVEKLIFDRLRIIKP